VRNSQEFFNHTAIFAAMGETVTQLSSLEIFNSIDSTNLYLRNIENGKSGSVCIAEQQTAGRGRRGRVWVSPFGCNLYLSLRWHFSKDLASLSGLSLIVGIAVVMALESSGVCGIKLKWPNDLVYHDHKLGGILIESICNHKSSCELVIGIGVNLKFPSNEKPSLQQPWIDIFSITQQQPKRNEIAGLILKELFLTLPQFESHGLRAFQKSWEQLDNLQERSITVILEENEMQGIAKGIDAQGNLMVQAENKCHHFHSGEVSVRLQPLEKPCKSVSTSKNT
jgi:BirA family transcriptional regulator, biotin operon repressor / biotin---[acetyl-CoA-carboxylase] ligase